MTNLLTTEHSTHPQWSTSSRLLRLGETIEFHFYLSNDVSTDNVSIYPRYLELAQPSGDFKADDGLSWLDRLPSETIKLDFSNGRASISYTPTSPGSYLARWPAGDRLFYRYFSVIEDDWIVLRLSSSGVLDPRPTFHGVGIPLDYRLPAAQFDREDPLFLKLLDYHRHYGETLIPMLPDMPPSYTVGHDQQVKLYELLLDRARSALPFPDDLRSARIEMKHDIDPGYTETLEQLGINDHCGLNEANQKPWLGMPEFPYFTSPLDCRMTNQVGGGEVVAHQWDFCGGYHFLGPAGWHYQVSGGEWTQAEACLREGFEELRNLTEFSGHPACAYYLYDGVDEEDPRHEEGKISNVVNPESGNGRARGHGALTMARFFDRYQRFMAFEAVKDYNVVYARSIDIADYYRNHFQVTPRTAYVSKTDHVMYDMWWQPKWLDDGILLARERIPRATRISSLNAERRANLLYKDPLSYEYIVIEDQQRSIRFERECSNPIWWMDYTRQERVVHVLDGLGRLGSAVAPVETPDVEIQSSGWIQDEQSLSLELKFATDETFPHYAIAIWGLPSEFQGDSASIETDAEDRILVWNRDGERHLVLFFDLKPNMELHVSVPIERHG
jgi:hypothetical protein